MCDCCNDRGCVPYKPSVFKRFSESLKNNLKKFNTALKLNFALGFLNWLYKVKDDGFVSYFENEWKLSHKHVSDKKEKRYYKEKEQSYKLLLRLYDFFAYTTGISNYCINKVFDFHPLSSLSLGDDEFRGVSNDGTSQNHRRSSVFRDSNGDVYDIDAISWVTDKRLDIAEDGKKHELELFPSNRCAHYGCVIAYDFNTEKWIPLYSGQKIIPNNNYEANHYFKVKCIELYDSTDKHNDFFTYIADIADIPEEFYHYFILDDCRNYRKNKFEEEIAYLEEHQMQNLLIAFDSYDLNDFVTSCSEKENVLKVNILYGSKRYAMLLMRELFNNGVSYDDMEFKYSDNCIYIRNYSANKNHIEEIIDIKFNADEHD